MTTRFDRQALGPLEAAARSHEIGDDLVELTCELAAMPPLLGERERRALGAVVLAALAGARQGSTRLELDGDGPASLRRWLSAVLDAAGLGAEKAAMRKVALALLRGDHLGGLVGRGDDFLPLVVDDGALYLQRNLARERRLAARVAVRLDDATATDGLDAALADVAARPPLREGAAMALSDAQRAAVHLAMSRRLAVIAGGPGTGKTATIAALVRVALRTGTAPSAIALTAPTGKAAQRMAAAVADQLERIADPAPADRAAVELPPAETLHRLLGYQPVSDRFRHDERQPIDRALVIADEASMIDLGLMERLFAAVPQGARLVLVGDPDQLPSVDAGSTLADLVELGEREPRAAIVGHLRESYRMNPRAPAGRAILAAADAVRRGRKAEVHDRLPPIGGDLLASGAHASTEASAAELADLAARWLAARLGDDRAAAEVVFDFSAGELPAPQAAVLAARLAALDGGRVLCASRRLPAGADAINRAVHAALVRGTALERADFVPGEPIIARLNDPARGLWNGDTGVVVRGIDRPGGRHHFRAVFPRAGGLVSYRLDALRGAIDLAWALTVHQSQGSEYDDVLCLLPPSDSPLVTRELLYTALTRARRSVLVAGPRAVLDAALARASQRASGLARRVTAALATDGGGRSAHPQPV